VSTQAGKGFFHRQEIQDLIALTRTLADTRDTLALGALFRGPLVGLTEAELLDIANRLPPDPDRPDRLPTLSLWTNPAHITLLGGAAAAWPLAAHAQQGERMRRIGVLLPATADDPEFQARIGAFLQGLQQSGWTIGRNVRIDTRWTTTDAAEIRRHAAELAALAPDVILASGTLSVAALRRVTRTLPIVFATVPDPVGAGFAESLARPGGNATGFMTA
jgi:hypothetical protein